MFTMTETQMKKNVTPVVQRIKAKEDGRPFLKRNEQLSELGANPAAVSQQVSEQPAGLQQMDDLEEVFEGDSEQRQQSADEGGSDEQEDDDDVNQIMVIGAEDEEQEPIGSSEISNDYN